MRVYVALCGLLLLRQGCSLRTVFRRAASETETIVLVVMPAHPSLCVHLFFFWKSSFADRLSRGHKYPRALCVPPKKTPFGDVPMGPSAEFLRNFLESLEWSLYPANFLESLEWSLYPAVPRNCSETKARCLEMLCVLQVLRVSLHCTSYSSFLKKVCCPC